jgi:hypothetical protein
LNLIKLIYNFTPLFLESTAAAIAKSTTTTTTATTSATTTTIIVMIMVSFVAIIKPLVNFINCFIGFIIINFDVTFKIRVKFLDF